jgi:hypothetical protein
LIAPLQPHQNLAVDAEFGNVGGLADHRKAD